MQLPWLASCQDRKLIIDSMDGTPEVVTDESRMYTIFMRPIDMVRAAYMQMTHLLDSSDGPACQLTLLLWAAARH